jgi:hypothetical protein
MNKKVRVTADEAGNVVIPSKNNTEWGHIRLEQERMVTDDRGFARIKKITALMPGLVSDLTRLGWKAGQEVEGKIIFREQLTPFNTKEPERDYKMAGKTNIPCCIHGEPIYRKTFYKEDANAKDVHILDANGEIVLHTNGDAIRAAYKAMAEKATTETEGGLGTM